MKLPLNKTESTIYDALIRLGYSFDKSFSVETPETECYLCHQRNADFVVNGRGIHFECARYGVPEFGFVSISDDGEMTCKVCGGRILLEDLADSLKAYMLEHANCKAPLGKTESEEA